MVDVGKTLSKVSLWSRDGRMLDRKTRPNDIVEVDGVRRLDVDGVKAFVDDALASHAGQPAEYIVPVAHGAGVAAVRDGELAFAPLDYEQPVPREVANSYARERDPFAVTGSPRLPDGLNFGAQLYWLERLHSAEMKGATLLPWAQYWAWHLSGVATTEVTSLGCHSDLWCPVEQDFAPMAKRMGWADQFAPNAAAGDAIGTLRPDLAEKTGLPATAKVLAGLHDSNAALMAARGFPKIARNEATVLSTGTWFVAMRLAASPLATSDLPESRDCLVNVDVFGNPVPSARFMGGREIESVIEIDTRRVDIKPDQPALLAAVPTLLAERTMLIPTLAPGYGPYPNGESRWVGEPRDWYARRAAMCLYAALVADTSLDLIGTRDRVLVEGRFAEAEVFTRALAALRPGTRVYTANAHNDVSFGALRLIDPTLEPDGQLTEVVPLPYNLTQYRETWHEQLKAPA